METESKQNGKKVSAYRRRRIAVLLLFAVLFFAAAAVTFVPGMPTWKQVFHFFGVSQAEADGYDMAVHYIDVGKADSIFITCNGKNILIDAGDVELSYKAAEYLKRQGVKNLDLVVATHPDKDHIGGMANVLFEFNTARFMMPAVPQSCQPNSTAYEAMLFAAQKKEIDVTSPQPGDCFSIGDMQVCIFAPQKEYDDTNNNSIVLQITYKQDSFLFMGDAEKQAEQDILAAGYDLRSEVLKVGHHGSDTSTTQAFLDAVQPKYAVISVGENNDNLPKKEVLDRLSKNSINTYRTDIDGMVILATNGDGIHVVTEK